jgi:hypothetical protein
MGEKQVVSGLEALVGQVRNLHFPPEFQVISIAYTKSRSLQRSAFLLSVISFITSYDSLSNASL